ncbi:hypothetical protein BLGI_2160 [Brevibacillus laterosporus GI-9]|nr:hypothetical protein BLGI_2160 [Brevibacillus laterosporus GI-9]
MNGRLHIAGVFFSSKNTIYSYIDTVHNTCTKKIIKNVRNQG